MKIILLLLNQIKQDLRRTSAYFSFILFVVISGAFTLDGYAQTPVEDDADIATITVKTNLAVTFVVTDVACYGEASGNIDLVVNGGRTPYTYAWTNGATTEDLANIEAGEYFVTVTDAAGCTVEGNTKINEPAKALSSSFKVNNILCNSSSTGAIDLTVEGGTAPYTYEWNNGETTEDISDLAANGYTVTITDANGCQIIESTTISEPDALSATLNVTDVLCKGGNDGAIDLTIQGGSSPYTYSWNNGEITEDIDALEAGNYEITITDANGCSLIKNVTVAEPAEVLTAGTSKEDVNCFGGSDGSINLSVSGGTAPYAYVWSNGETTEDINGLIAGNYSVLVTDAHGCEVNSEVTINEPEVISVSFDISDENGFEANDGEAIFTITGGTGNYTYTISPSATFDSSTNTYSNLDTGDYNFTATDDNGCIFSEVFTIKTINQIPVASDDVYTAGEDSGATTLTPAVTGNDDFGGDGAGSTAITITVEPEHGTASVDDNGTPTDPTDDTIIYTPEANYNGTDSIIYEITDSNGDSDSADVTITVTPDASDADVPVATDDAYTVGEDSGATTFTPAVTGNDNFGGDGAGSTAITITVGPEHGTASVDDNGTPTDPTDDTIIYTPEANYNGTDSITYEITDSNDDSDTAEVTITVTPDASDADVPLATDDAYTVGEDSGATTLTPAVTNNDDFGGDGAGSTAITITVEPEHGTASVDDNGTPTDPTDDTIIYTPEANYNGTDSITYEITDSNGDSDTADVTITVTPDASDADVPVATDDAYTVGEDSGATTLTPAVTGNDDFGGDGAGSSPITITVGPEHGTASVDDNGTPTDPTDDTIIYTPESNYNGTDSITYEITDSNGDSNTAEVTITVTPDASDADVPVATDDAYTAGEDSGATTLTPAVTGNDDFGGDGAGSTAITITVEPEHGTASVDDNGTPTDPTDDTIIYTPESNYNGTDSITYEITDSNGDSDTAVVSITVTPDASDADVPVATDDVYTVGEDSGATTLTPAVTNNDNFGGDGAGSRAITITVEPEHGTASVDDNGTPSDPTDDTIIYTPEANYNGTDSITYEITDSNGDSDSAEVIITVTPDDSDLPIANDDNYTLLENSNSNILTPAVTSNDDFGGDGAGSSPITITVGPEHGTASVDDNDTPTDPTDDTLIYTPNADYDGVDSITYKIEDANGDSDTAVVNIIISNSQIGLIKTGVFADESGDGYAQVGETISYSFSVTNTGDVTISGVKIEDALIGISALAITPATLLPGETGTATASYTITQTDIDQGQITNTALASGTDPQGGTVTDTSDDNSNLEDDPTVTNLPGAGAIGLIKTGTFTDESGDGYAQVGETISYSFSVTNTGDVTISGVTIEDALIGISDLAITPATLLPGESGTATATYTITQTDIDQGQITNTAIATGTDPAGQPVTDTSDDNSNLEDDPTVTTLPGAGTIGLIKTGTFTDESGDGYAQVGETISYSFSVTNTGDVSISGVTIEDALIGISALTITPATLLPGETGTATASYTITQTDIDQGQITNTALASGTDPQGGTVTDTSDDNSNLEDDPTVTNLPGAGAIGLIKTGTFTDESGDGYAQVGETISYSFSVTNTGDVTISGVTIEDALIGISDLAITPATLLPGESGTATATYTITQTDIDQGQITNTAIATGTDPAGQPVTDTSDDNSNLEDDPTVTTLPGAGTIGLIKTGTFTDESGDGYAQVGETISYSFSVTNTGDVTISGVTIEDALIGISALTITPATLLPGETGTATASYTITQTDIDHGQITNTALASGTDPQGGTVTDTSDDNSNLEDDPTVTNLPGAGAIGLIKMGVFTDESGDGYAQVGETISYSFSVTNTGDVTISGVTIEDTLIGISALAITPATLLPGETGTATASYTITQTDIDQGQITNTALASGTDPQGGTVTDTSDNNSNLEDDPTVTNLPGAGAIGLIKTGVFTDESGDGYAQVGETISYSFSVTNTGDVSISGVTIEDTLIGIGALAITPATLLPGETGTATASYTITQTDIDQGQITNTALASGTDPQGGTVTDTSDDNSNLEDDPTVTNLPGAGAIGLIKTGTFTDESGDGYAQVGETISYSFSVTNTGDVTISGVTIEDALIGISDLAITPATLLPGESGTATASYTITQTDIDQGQITNTALASGTDPQGGTVTDTSDDNSNLEDDPTVTNLPGAGAIGLIKTGTFTDESGDGYAQVGETISYSFSVTNTGDVTIIGVMIEDTLIGISDLAITPATLLPGESGTATASYTITQTDIDQGQITNTALASGTDPQGGTVTDTSDDNSNLEDDPTVTVLPQLVSLSLEKSAVLNDEDGDGIPEVGETITYSFRVINNSQVTIYDIIIEDPIVDVEGGPVDLEGGAEDSTTFTAIYTITESDIEEGSVINQATVSGTNLAGALFEDLSDDPNDSTDYDANGDGEPDDPTIVEFQGVLPIEDIIIHNVMTPNGDGMNDIFMIQNIENFPNNTVEIFNRWGVQVYKAKGYNPMTDNVFRGYSDGRATIRRGERLPTGTYYYVVNYETSEGEIRKLAGFLYIN
ncbi:Ig-like domain-containing protein [Leeuwenhoekiella sp. A16]|uniref:DUF7507 domain-containing protein n=1 Tax=Leeuwenhoekiella sp. A16 TaxID=3141462 RepID=UPI003A806334